MAPAITLGEPILGYNPSRGFSLPTPRDFRGRVGLAVPSPGIILKAASGGTAPITHAVSNLPSGLSFDATTLTISGSPTSAHASRAVVLEATDASTPAETVSATFEFPVVGSGAAITRDDWDGRGYGVSSRETFLLALIGSQVNIGFSDATLWRRPPQSGNVTGHLLDDDGNELTDLADMTFTAGGESVFVDRILMRQGVDRIVFYESSALHFGTYAGDVLGSPTLYIRIGNDEQAIPYNSGFSADLQFRRSSPDLGEFIRSVSNGTRVLFGVAS